MTNLNQNDDNDFAQQEPNDADIFREPEFEEDESSVVEESAPSVEPSNNQDESDENDLDFSDEAEEDLLTILEHKINSEENAEVAETVEDDSTENVNDSIIIPRQKNEQHCQRCWMLVRTNAPKCPAHDDDCPIFQGVG